MTLDKVIEQDTLEVEDIARVFNMGLEWFILELAALPLEEKRHAYAYLLQQFLRNIRNNVYGNNPYIQRDLADALHNLPTFLLNGFKGFSDEYFWYGITTLVLKVLALEMLQEDFIKGLRDYRHRKRGNPLAKTTHLSAEIICCTPS